MDYPESAFVIIENKTCPLYNLGDEFKLKGRSLSLMGKQVCLTLMGDISRALETVEKLRLLKLDSDSGHLFNCSGYKTGCPGTIRLGYQKEKKPMEIARLDNEISAIANVLGNFSMFASLSEYEIREIVSYFRIKRFPKGETIIRKGDPGVKLYIIVSGKVEVVGDNGILIAFLDKGEVFGEMSLISGNPVSTTVRVVESAKIMYMYGNYFRKVLNRFPSIQIYFARLLVSRLDRSNLDRSVELGSGITGKLSEISAAELLQVLNLTQKTGVLNLNLPGGLAKMSFREGHLIRVEYNERAGEEAFFEILKQKEGRFNFRMGLSGEEMSAPEVGDFMWLLMEGLNRIDEHEKVGSSGKLGGTDETGETQ